MFENDQPWTLPVLHSKPQGYNGIFKQIGPEGKVSNLKFESICIGCNLPGGQQFKGDRDVEVITEDGTVIPKPDTWCDRSQKEKGKCEAHRAFIQDWLCKNELCDSLECQRCKRKSKSGHLRPGDLVIVNGQVAQDVTGPQGQPMQMLAAARMIGRYKGKDVGNSLRFEAMLPKKGIDQKSGYRFWLMPSGQLVQDVTQDELNQLSVIEIAKSGVSEK